MAQRILHQRYELLELIGGGGMADVYRARDKLLDRPVAVKILHEQFKSDREFIDKFHREAQAAARLSHANIVNIFDVGVEGNDHYIVMEYVPGSTLKDLIKQQGHLPVAQALRVAEDIARALAHAHDNNLVHCDMPHNILMMPDGSAKVADFGIARAVTESTMTYTGNIVGSVHYFSPEQAKGTMITPKSDVYALGVVLYEMLTGVLPFTGETPVSIAVQHLQDTPRPVRELEPSIPPAVEAIVSRTMSKAPEARPSSDELVEELRQAEHMVSTGSAMTAPDPYATQVMPRVSQADMERVRQEEEYEEEPEEDSSIFKSKKFIAGLVMVLMVGFFAGAFMSFGKFWSTSEIIVPDVTGKPMALARQILEDQKLRVNVAEVYDATVPAGTVVSQTPEAGTKVKEERMVTINVSRGGEELDMPDLLGLDRADAEIKLKKMGLKLGSVYEKFSDEEEGTVIGQEPRSGTRISKGQTIDITISKGKKVKKVTVPNVKGGTLSAAEGTLKGKGLSVSVEKRESSQASGTVISQSPAADSEVESGSTVTLVIAEEASVKKETSEVKGSEKKQVKPEIDGAAPSKQGDTGKRQ